MSATIPDPTPEKAAPEPLRLVQLFVNTTTIYETREPEEELVSPEALRAWLLGHDLLDASAEVSEADLARALDLREGLRAVLFAHNGGLLERASVERLDRAARRAGVRVGFGPSGEPELVPEGSGVDAALGRLLAIVAAASEQGTWQRLKACSRECCLWAFYDHSRNRSGRWCSMESCGNVEKARAFRRRHRHGGD
jgi:predicted RNA-binding Zn ribbon-like protein